MIRHSRLHFGGSWQESSSDRTLTIVSPSTEETIGEVPDASPCDVNRAVNAAREAFDGGRTEATRAERADLLERIADALGEQEAELAATITGEMGQSLAQSRAGVRLPIAWCRFYADTLRTGVDEEYREDPINRAIVMRQPIGVVAALTPFNGGIAGALQKLIPVLAVGCTAIWKPAHQTPLSGYRLMELFDEVGVPPGVINLVTGGRETGEALVAHPSVDMVAFTGSTQVGRAIMATAAQRIARLVLELGGKSAAIILDDADLSVIGSRLPPMTMMISGQVCHCQSRVLVPESRYDEVADVLCDAVEQISVGDPFDESVFTGPLVTAEQRHRVERLIESGKRQGARLLVGGVRPADKPRGWFLVPAVFGDVDPSMEIAREEIFGPVMSLIPYKRTDDAVKIANDSIYGLSGSVWTADEDAGLAVARRLRTGQVSVNGAAHPVGAPFGGFKRSGIGRQRCRETLDEYTELKSVALTGRS